MHTTDESLYCKSENNTTKYDNYTWITKTLKIDIHVVISKGV